MRASSRSASLDPRRTAVTIQRSHKFSGSNTDIVADAVHRFEESIAGRLYQIEVSAVARDRWRAHIVRLPGVPTAMMPFYGSTPAEAARQLCEWLTRAHQRVSPIPGTA